MTKLAIGGMMAAMAAMAMLSQAGRVSAQYPVPEGSCAVSISGTTTEPNGNVDVTAKVVDINGNPIAGVTVNLSISQQPGGASLSSNSATTNGQGVVKASLTAGGAGGLIVVTAHTSEVSCSGSVVVGQEAVLASVALPDTGDGSNGNGDSPAILAAFLLGALGVVSVAFAVSRRSARNS